MAGISKHLFDRYIAEGMPVLEKPANRGAEYVVDSVEALDWIVNRPPPLNVTFDRERARLAAEQADQQALRNAELRATLLPADEVEAAWKMAQTRVRKILDRTADEVAKAGVAIVLADRLVDPARTEHKLRLMMERHYDRALAQLAKAF